MFIKQRLRDIRAANMSMLFQGSSQATFYAQTAKSFGSSTVRTASTNSIQLSPYRPEDTRYFSDYDHGVGTSSTHSSTSGVARTAGAAATNVAWSGFRGMGRLSMGGDMDTVNTNGTIGGYGSRILSNPSQANTLRRSARAPAATQLSGNSSTTFIHSPMAMTGETKSITYSTYHYTHLGGRAAAGDLIFMSAVLSSNSGYSLGSNGPCRGTSYTSAPFTGVYNPYGGETTSNSAGYMITNQHTSQYADTSWWAGYFIAQGGEDVVRHRFYRFSGSPTYQLVAGIIHGPFNTPTMNYIASEGTNVSLSHQLGSLKGRGEHTVFYLSNPFVCTTQIGNADDSILQGNNTSPNASWSIGTYEEGVDGLGKLTGTARYLRIKSPTNQGSNDHFKVSVRMI